MTKTLKSHDLSAAPSAVASIGAGNDAQFDWRIRGGSTANEFAAIDRSVSRL